MFANRLRKNLERLGGWAAREGIDCYRLYDADMPEYAFAIDVYGREEPHVHLQEYAPPEQVSVQGARERRREVLSVVPQVLGVPLERVRRPRGVREQYEKLAATTERHAIEEGGLKFWINFRDYLDTGIFLDHRLVRARLRALARGADFLNLFCYTATASVYAAAGGARSTVGVDLSNTYLEWARQNFLLNGFTGPEHALERADCLAWLEAQAPAPRFDLIYIDPPTFSNSKRMQGVLDIQRDHVKILNRALTLLRAGGDIVFSTHYERFRLDRAALEEMEVEDLSAATLPKDFERHPRMHHCYRLRARAALTAGRAAGSTASRAPAKGA
jgi:23S rRNA (guanine2445-N2)-methyltransferase / 23S rRNA (guanine2069-N7)-methyltransferase